MADRAMDQRQLDLVVGDATAVDEQRLAEDRRLFLGGSASRQRETEEEGQEPHGGWVRPDLRGRHASSWP